MKLFFLILIHILKILAESPVKRDLNFVQSVSNSSRKNEYIMRRDPIEVDAFPALQILITVQKIAPLKFFCQTENLNPDYPLANAYLCLKENLNSKDRCIDVRERVTVKFPNAQFSINFNLLKGFEANLLSKSSKYLNGYMYCILENSVDRIVSNPIEIQNLNYYNNLISTSYSPIPMKQNKNRNIINIFDCGIKNSNKDEIIPTWLRPLMDLQFIWFLCPDHAADEYCYKPIWKTLKENEHYMIMSNYSIQLFDSAFKVIDDFRLQCNRADNPRFSIYGVSGELNIPSNKIEVYSPQISSVEIREGICDPYKYKLIASYNTESTGFTWQKDNKPIANNFQYDSHVLTFPKNIDVSHQGNYLLEVYRKEAPFIIKFEYKVKVVRLPQVVKGFEVPKVVYAMSERSLNLTTQFTGSDIKTLLEINNFPISTANEINQKLDLKKFKLKHPYLSQMNIKISEKEIKTDKEVNYQIEKIQGLWFKKGHSHRVTFLAFNEVGSTRISTLIKAIEKPRWKVHLNQYSCTEKCFSNEPHYFKCAIFSEEFTEVGLKVNYQWRINGVDIVTLFSEELRDIYFTINQETLILNKISTSNNVRDLRIIEKLHNTTLSCSVLISVKNGEDKLEEIYNSWNDPVSMPFVQANVSITANNVLQGGSSYLIWIICIPFILITIVTTVIVCVCYFMRSGKTYDIDLNERIAGKDPEQETFDSLYFKHYNREEDNEIVMTDDHVSWSDRSYKTDTGEIDTTYDTENEIFDEGSIVGQYANENRR